MQYPLGLGDSHDVAKMCVFLLSDDAKWITGQNIVIDGAIVQSSDDTMELRRDINGKKVTLRCINSTDAEFIVAFVVIRI
jgi:NAD(P)-dependent dehydrogenase (short-subunit alcohol dehydrogenase family)